MALKDDAIGKRIALGVVTLVGAGILYVVGMDIMVNRIAPVVGSPFPVYTTGFLLGAWSVVTMTFVSNYVARRFYGVTGISYRVHLED